MVFFLQLLNTYIDEQGKTKIPKMANRQKKQKSTIRYKLSFDGSHMVYRMALNWNCDSPVNCPKRLHYTRKFYSLYTFYEKCKKNKSLTEREIKHASE